MEGPIYRLPPFKVHRTYQHNAAGQQVDWSHANFGIADVHLRTKGLGIKVAILDTGIDLDHPDLQDQIVATRDFTRSPRGVDDSNGHGTHCSGVVAAIDNSVGVIGVAPQARLIIGKVLGDDGSGFDDWIAAGIRWAIQQGAHIISMSLGSPQYSAVSHKAVQEAVQAGVIVVAAAGNSGLQGVDYPGKLAETLAVGAVDRNNRRADFSAVGAEVDVAGPGVEILSTYPNGRVATLSGTSMATPFVAGSLACVLSYRNAIGNPVPSLSQLRNLLSENSVDAGTPGRDKEFGWGLVRPGNMLGDPPQPPPPPPVDPGEPPWEPVKSKIKRIFGSVDLKVEYE